MSVLAPAKCRPIAFPQNTLIAHWLVEPDFADAYAFSLPLETDIELAALARLFFNSFPGWMKGLLVLRNLAASLFGLKTGRDMDYLAELAAFDASPGSRVGLFELREIAADELMFGQEDGHLDFRLSIIVTSDKIHTSGRSVFIAATSVRFNNRLGRYYMALVKPFHRAILKATLNKMTGAVRRGGR